MHKHISYKMTLNIKNSKTKLDNQILGPKVVAPACKFL
jgi:hypothetical protein